MKINLGQLLTRRAFISPNVEAIVEPGAGGRRVDFRELNARSNRVVHALRASGVRHGDRVALLMGNGVEFVESFFAVAKIGAVNVPLNWRLVADELEFILEDSGSTVLLYSAAFAPVAAELQRRGAKTKLRLWVQVGGEAPAFALGYEAWSSGRPPQEIEPEGFDDDLLFIMYTSGTTGLPKGVMHSHRTVFWAVLSVAVSADLRCRDRFLTALPLFHVGALTPSIAGVYIGFTQVILMAFDPALAWELIRDERIGNTLLVPAMLQFMQATYDKAAHDASTLRFVLCGAAPVPVTLIRAYAEIGVEVHQLYGLTESCGPGCLILGEDALVRAGSTGRAYFHTDVKVIGPGGGECPPGEPGEIVIRGPHNMVGYWNRPDATAQALRDGWLHTGDIGTMDEQGFVTIRDRMKDMLISGGENIYPAEVENMLLAHPALADAAVIGIASPKWGEVPLAVVVAKKGMTLGEAELLAWCKGRLAAFKLPKAALVVGEIPRNPSGKILKRVLRERYASAVKAPE
jgi:acyl-CoA synthetase (AMP-forming)/AMP-acid ligase II